MKKMNALTDKVMLGLGIAVLAVSSGCIVPVGGGYSGDVIVPGPPDVLLFGGGYDRSRDVHDYSQRGYSSREAEHSGGGREVAHRSEGRETEHSGGGHSPAPHGGGGGEAKRR